MFLSEVSNNNNNNNSKKKENEHEIIQNKEERGGGDDEDDGIKYDGELEIHHSPISSGRSNVSKLYSSLLQSHYNNHTTLPMIEIIETSSSPSSPLKNEQNNSLKLLTSETNNPIHQNNSSTKSPSSSSSSSSLLLSIPNPSIPSNTTTTTTTNLTNNNNINNSNEYSSLSSSSPLVDHSNKRNLSTTARFQRYIVSKMANTSTGQELMTQALNEEGQMVVNWLISAVKKCNFIILLFLLLLCPLFPVSSLFWLIKSFYL